MVKFDDVTLVLGMGRGRKNFEIKVKYVDDRKVEDCEGYPYRYSIRGSDYEWGKFATVEKFVCVNFCGYVFSKTELPLKADHLPIRDYWYSH